MASREDNKAGARQSPSSTVAAGASKPSHYLDGLEGGSTFLLDLIDLARELKADPERFYRQRPLEGKVLAAVFLNPSLRTRTSFEAGIARLGGHMMNIAPGAGAWDLEFDTGVVMDGSRAEHIIEAAGVLSSYADLIALRAFGTMQDFAEEMKDQPVHQLADHATVPVINLESARHHPCQALADSMTIVELLGDEPKGRKFTLTWASHPKMVGMAVPHAALLAAARLGMEVSVAHPEGYDLHEPTIDEARRLAEANGGGVRITNSLTEACEGTEVIYAKSWGSSLDYGNTAGGAERNARYKDWTVGMEHIGAGKDARFMHCLPVRRNVIVTDEVMDSPASAVQQQAANRMWGQMALMLRLLNGEIGAGA